MATELMLDASAIGKVGPDRKGLDAIRVLDTSQVNEDGTVRKVAYANLAVRVTRDDGLTSPAWLPVKAFGKAAERLSELNGQLVYVTLGWQKGNSREKGGFFRDTFVIASIATVSEHEAEAK